MAWLAGVRRVVILGAALLSLLLGIAIAALWSGGTHWIRYGYSLDGTKNVGVGSYGIYAQDGRIALIHLESGTGPFGRDEWKERAAVAPIQPGQLGWVWTRSGDLPTYHGGIPADLIPTYATWSIPRCLWCCQMDEAGMHQFTRARTVIVCAPILLALFLLPVAALIVARCRNAVSSRRLHALGL